MLAHAVRRVPLSVWAILIALLPICLQLISTLANFPISSGDPIGLADPDSWLRLTLVRDWLSGGSWYDHSYASNAPLERMQSPWTRPMDLVIAAFTQLQWGGELTLRLVRTSMVLPMVWLALIMSALLFATRRLTRMPHAVPLVGVLFVSALINHNYLGVGNADHHGPLSALFCWVVALLINHDPRRRNGLVAIGALLALMLWINPEAMLMIAIVYGWLGLQWLAGSSLRPLVRVAITTALLSTIAVMIERPVDQWSVRIYDSISLTHLLPLALVAVAAILLARITSFFWLWRLLAATALLGAMAAAIYLIDPLFYRGPMAQAHPFIHSGFLPRIGEAAPAWSNPLWKIAGLMLQPLLALGVAWRCATQRNGILPAATALCLLYVLLTTAVLYFIQIRWAYYFFPLVPLVLAPFVAAWLNPQHNAVASYWPAARLRRLNDKQMMARRIPLLLMIFALPSLLMALPALLDKDSDKNDMRDCQDNVRRVIQSGELAKLGGGKSLILFAPTDTAPEMLFFTPHRVIASNYHREGAGLQEVMQAQGSNKLADLQRVVKQRRADVVIICPDHSAGADAAIHRLHDGRLKAPWLVPYRIKTTLTPKDSPSIFLVNG